jgi:hypothetical protein
MAYFNLPECDDEVAARKLRAIVKQWTLKKMAELFQVWKKIMEKLPEEKRSASIRRVSNKAGESLEGI